MSEIMLQQTQVARVIDRYAEFLTRFPTPQACASAEVVDVLGAWHGLGYNRRALNLHRAARRMVEHHGGQVPDNLIELLALPGVGTYTARAVLSFAYGRDHGVVDTNVGRVLARSVAGRPLCASEAQALADQLVPTGRSWPFNQTMFDLGARYCRAGRPDCDPCPLRRHCAWRAAGGGEPDPSRRSAGTAQPQSTFQGSDRQGRGRLVAALLAGPIPSGLLGTTAGWPQDPSRARAVAETLVHDGLARWAGEALGPP